MPAAFHVHGDLGGLLKKRWRGSATVMVPVDRRTSIKDMLESFGLPHTEIGLISTGNREIGFDFIVENERAYHIHPVPVPWNVTVPTVLRPVPLPAASFMVDINAGRLARYLRAAGFDTLCNPRLSDERIALMMPREKRVLLTRDRGLLMRKTIVFGRWIRETDPVRQLKEIVGLFGLQSLLAPFTRCLDCNTLLEPVAKEEILHRLEPLTKIYYRSFSRCASCDRIYWHGSHVERMEELLSRI